jgi:hypothetical protein
LEAFLGEAAEHHGPDAAIADRQRLIPVGGGLLVPEHHEWGIGRGSVSTEFTPTTVIKAGRSRKRVGALRRRMAG